MPTSCISGVNLYKCHKGKVLKPEPELGLLERLRRISPFSMEYWRYWRAELPLMLLAHVFFPFMILWLFLRWLSDATAMPIRWPQEVLDAIGPEIEYIPRQAPGHLKA